MGNAQPTHSKDAFREKGRFVKTLIFKGSGAAYEVKDADTKSVLYKFSLSENLTVKRESDDSTYFSMNPDGEILNENGTKKGTITCHRLMPGTIQGKLSFVFKSSETEMTLVR